MDSGGIACRSCRTKLFVRLDRRDPRDAADLQKLMETYADSGNTDRLYESEAEELARVGYDIELAGAYLLGKDARSLTAEITRTQLLTAFNKWAIYFADSCNGQDEILLKGPH